MFFRITPEFRAGPRFYSCMSKATYKPPTLEQCLSNTNLQRAAAKVASYYRTQNYPYSPDRAFPALMEDGLADSLRTAVLDGNYAFQPLRPYWTPKPNNRGTRMESMSSAMDRILIQALFNQPGHAIQRVLSATAAVDNRVVAPAYRFTRPHSPYTYSYWPADYRSYRAQARRYARKWSKGVALHLDIQNFYPSIRIDRLKTLLRPWFADDVFELVAQYLEFQTVTETGEVIPYLAGLPIEEPVSRLLAGVYIQALDHYVLNELNVDYVRYVDDMIVFMPDSDTAEQIKNKISRFLALHLGVFINEAKADIKPCPEFMSKSEAAFSRRLSVLNTQVMMTPFMPAAHRVELVGELRSLVRDMPSPNLPPDQPKSRMLLRGAKFGAWRLARVQAEECTTDISVLLSDARTRMISAVALAHFGTPTAASALQNWLNQAHAALLPFERVQIAGALARNNLLMGFRQFDAYAANDAMLRAILAQCPRSAQHVAESLADPVPMVRRAGLIACWKAKRCYPSWTQLQRAARTEQDRDSIILFIRLLAEYGPRARKQIVAWTRHPDPLVAAMAAAVKTLEPGQDLAADKMMADGQMKIISE